MATNRMKRRARHKRHKFRSQLSWLTTDPEELGQLYRNYMAWRSTEHNRKVPSRLVCSDGPRKGTDIEITTENKSFVIIDGHPYRIRRKYLWTRWHSRTITIETTPILQYYGPEDCS